MHLQIQANYNTMQQGRTSQSLLSDWCFDTMQLFRILYKPLTSPSFYFINFQHENSHRCEYLVNVFVNFELCLIYIFLYKIVCFGAIFAFQANATITSIKKPGAFNEAFTGSDKFIDICSTATAYTLEDGKAAVVYTSGPLAAGTSM